MKKILLIFFLLFCYKVYSQEPLLDVIFFKDGTKIAGVITELTPGVNLKITDKNGKDYTFSLSVVDHIEKLGYNRDEFLLKPRIDSLTGFNKLTNLTKIGLARNVVENKYNFTISNLISYQFKYTSAGFGISYMKNDSDTFVPIYLDLKYTFNYPSYKPYFFGDVGYVVANKSKGDVYFGLGSGLKLPVSNSFNLIFEFAYTYFRTGYKLGVFDVSGYKDFITFNAGIQF